jgi:hypothetical protein
MAQIKIEFSSAEVSILLNSLREANLKLRESMFLTIGTEHYGPLCDTVDKFYELEQRIFHEHRAQLKELAKDQK